MDRGGVHGANKCANQRKDKRSIIRCMLLLTTQYLLELRARPKTFVEPMEMSVLLCQAAQGTQMQNTFAGFTKRAISTQRPPGRGYDV